MTESIGKEFMRLTRYENMSPSLQEQGLPQPPLEVPCENVLKKISLPAIDGIDIPAMDVRQALGQRRTFRKYSDHNLTLEELAYLLWATQGVKSVKENAHTFRVVPSAGARHAFETYLLINRVDGLEPGLYRYLALDHSLALLPSQEDLPVKLSEASLKQSKIAYSAVTFIWVAVRERMIWRYNERGYRYLHLDAGHVCQNLYTAAETIDCGLCAIAAYDDEQVNALLGLDGEEMFAIYLASLGKK
jgi:SagB-type dehydrogenase family enzyme